MFVKSYYLISASIPLRSIDTIRDLEWSESQKVFKSEFSSTLNKKANVSDVSRMVAEISASLQNRPTVTEIDSLIEEKVGGCDLQ